jgi:hypothetical protein
MLMLVVVSIEEFFKECISMAGKLHWTSDEQRYILL